MCSREASSAASWPRASVRTSAQPSIISDAWRSCLNSFAALKSLNSHIPPVPDSLILWSYLDWRVKHLACVKEEGIWDPITELAFTVGQTPGKMTECRRQLWMDAMGVKLTFPVVDSGMFKRSQHGFLWAGEELGSQTPEYFGCPSVDSTQE